ncbi:hypothetical protein V501_01533 [Pseudogymnoascus sp. VKM F-4519 (FW-2642)]|nr:hypothetical protein V501_01533 [Pseudogymnoascus sp. VKM F-4519 (FW-2642)]
MVADVILVKQVYMKGTELIDEKNPKYQNTKGNQEASTFVPPFSLIMPVHGRYTTEKVKYPSHGETITGVLYRPTNITNPPGVVVTGPYSFIKEQAPTQYATHLADEGYAA